MDRTSNLSLPYIMPAQAQKHVTHNEAIRTLDALVMASVENGNSTEPPANPGEGEQYLVAADATGIFAGKDNTIAAFQDGAWSFLQPRDGWIVWDKTQETQLVFTGGQWHDLSAVASGQLPQLGVNTEADATNRLSVRSAASLFSHDESGSHRLVVNRQSAANTASTVFQTGFSGRAEIGLTGDDHLSVKVSSDGVSFQEAIVIDHETGGVTFPKTAYSQDMFFNLYQDGGRLCITSGAGVSAGNFRFPKYLTLYNGALAAGHGKFIHDNSTHGGAAGALDPDVDALVSKLRNTGAPRRYGVEYWVARIAAGSGQSVTALDNGITYYLCLFTSQLVRLPSLTFHAYLRAKTAPVLLRQQAGQTIRVDGTVQAGNVVLAPSDGWRAVQIQDSQPLRTNLGYAPMTLNLYTQTQGDEVLIACPAMTPGLVNIDPDAGLIAGYNSWAAE